MNTKHNFFTAIKKLALLPVLFVSISNAQGVFITELADPHNEANNGRFVELHNSTSVDIDLAAGGYSLQRHTNAQTNITSSHTTNLSGVIPAGGFYVVGRSGFEGLYGFAPDQVSNAESVNSNGDDKIFLVDGSNNVVDIFGIPGQSSTIANGMDFENGRAERKAFVSSGSPTWVAAEWNVVSGGVNAPDGFDPGAWVGFEPHMGIVFSGTFGNSVYNENTYTFPTGAESWAGFANQDASIYPFEFPNGGVIEFIGNTGGPDASINFKFEYQPDPNTEPSFSTQSITVSGIDPLFYQVEIPPQGDNTYSSFLLYVETRDVAVTLTNIHVHEHSDSLDIDPCADETLNCDNLHLIGIVGPETIKEIINENFINEDTNLPYNIDDLAAMALNPGEQQFMLSIDAPSWSDEPGTLEASYFPEIGSIEDSFFVFIYEVPGGYPEDIITYRWRLDLFNSQGSIFTKGENAIFNSLGEEDTDCLISLDEDGLVRYWNPEDWTYELNEISSGNMDPAEIFNFDLFGGCEFYDDDQPEWATFLGEFEGREYYIAEIDLKWHDAKDTAYWYEGHLATITSEAENQFILDAILMENGGGEYWIGGYESYYDSETGNRSFSWVTDEPFDYANWGPEEPNNPGEESAIEFMAGNAGDWNDLSPMIELGSILEFPSDDGPEPEMSIVFSGTFGNSVYNENTYTFPTGAESWAGFANQDASIYPFEFPNGGVIEFIGNTGGPDASINFKFEYQPDPNTEPSFSTQSITVSGIDPLFYQVEIPPQGDNTYSSFLLYVETRDVAVTLTNIHVHEHGSGPEIVTFTKPDNADPSLAENQDRISESVWITRGNGGGALYNAALETGYSNYVSPLGTKWAYGPTFSQSSYDNYTSIEDVVYSFSSGFANVVGETFSLHVLETNMFYDVTFTSWAQGGGGGNGSGGAFSYVRTTVDGGIDPPGPLSFSNYTLSISDAESYLSASESSLPSLNVDGDGIVIKAEFAISDDISEPYVGALGVFWDANFNGQLDEGDHNISENFYDSNGDDDMEEDGPRNREHDEGPGVVALVDNGPMDTDDAVGIFVGFIDDIDFMAVQGATFLFAEINDEGDPTNSLAVKPYSSAGIRFSGQATANSSGEPVDGIFVRVEKLIYVEDDNWGPYFDHVDVAQGVTQISGEYNIGSSQLNIGDSVEVLVESALNERLYPLIGSVDDGFGMEIGFNIDAGQDIGETYSANISVMKLNTIVQGFVLNENGMPLTGEVMIVSHLGAEGEIMIDSYAEVDENGFYSGWSMNGSEADIVFFPYDGSGQPIDNTVMIQSDTFDEELDAYVFNYNIEMSSSQMGTIYGWLAFYDFSVNNPQPLYLDGQVTVYNENGFSTTVSTGVDGSEPGRYKVDVPVGYTYYLTATSNNDEYVSYEIKQIGVDSESIEDYQVNFEFILAPIQYYTISGYVYDQNAEPVYDAEVNVESSDMNNDDGDRDHDGWYDWVYTDASGYYSISVPAGVYDMDVVADGFLYKYAFGIEVNNDVVQDFNLNPVGEFTGGVQGVVTLIGGYILDEPVYIEVESNLFSASAYADENGFFSIDLIDGVYDIYANTMGYNSYYMENAFEVSGNTVIYDFELFEYGFAGPPHMMDLHDVANDQGRQVRAVWDAGMPGDWGYFTQFSIWRKVNNAPIELWDYIETVPWHGMNPYAAVVPTLGDSSAHGVHMSTFMVTAHTNDVSVWLDSEPMSGYSIDNLHPEAPMSLAFSTNPGAVSLTWSGPTDEDFSYFNIYRQDIMTNEPAMVFTTTDSFYVDQELSDVGAYEYWVTAVDMSGLESDASSIVSAVLSAEEDMRMPTEFALKQNYPNPFNPSTQIQYALPSETRVLISIYDLTGRKVRTLVNEVQSAGHRSVMWNATNEIGRPVSAGMYIYTIQAGDFIQNRKMVLMK